MIDSPLFTPFKIGPVTLRNRIIRSAAFENMAYGNSPSQDLYDYHVAVARGGVGMTTLAYASVNRSGLSFDGQLWMREEIVPGLKRITDAVHAAGAKCSIQLGHCGNMTHRASCGCMPVGASGGFNLYSPTFVRGLKISEIDTLVDDFGQAVELARRYPSLHVNLADPGIVASDMIDLGHWYDPLADLLFKPLCKSPQAGVRPALRALTEGEKGRYYVGKKCRNIPARYIDPSLDERLWAETRRLVEPV